MSKTETSNVKGGAVVVPSLEMYQSVFIKIIGLKPRPLGRLWFVLS